MKKIISISLMVVFMLGAINCQAQKGKTKKKAPVKKANKETMILIKTSMGNLKVKLYNETPLHRDNFIKLVKEGYLNKTLFHRVIKDFMIQGGDPDSKTATKGQVLGNGGPTYTIPAEFVPSKFHKKGTLAAARTGDDINPKKESSGSQFYIVQGKKYTDAELNMFEQRMGKKFTPEQRAAYKTVGGTPHLDGSYTVFGELVEGFDVLDKIAAVPCDPNNRPLEDVVMISFEIIK
jgi:cyclophilin family peptidyl-prolyl cis-trans isomerase